MELCSGSSAQETRQCRRLEPGMLTGLQDQTCSLYTQNLKACLFGSFAFQRIKISMLLMFMRHVLAVQLQIPTGTLNRTQFQNTTTIKAQLFTSFSPFQDSTLNGLLLPHANFMAISALTFCFSPFPHLFNGKLF